MGRSVWPAACKASIRGTACPKRTVFSAISLTNLWVFSASGNRHSRKNSRGRRRRRKSSGSSCKWSKRELGSNRSSGGSCRNCRERSSGRKPRRLVRGTQLSATPIYLGQKYIYPTVGVHLTLPRVIPILGLSVKHSKWIS